MTRTLLIHLAALFCLTLANVVGAVAAGIPRPLANHPGNIFLAGDEVVVRLPADASGDWIAVDFEDRTVATGRAQNGRAALGRLPAGYFELHCATGRVAATNRTSLGVIPRLRAPTPGTSPIGLDVAMAWFYPEEKMPAVASLCALAGVNHVRDRLNWAEMESARGRFAAPNRYDTSAHSQAAAGLRVLQVTHISPAWANPDTKRFPLDLRDAYNFWREMAWRWRGQVTAFEPWNEADIEQFGGHTGNEIASLQKAAYLGLKAGNPNVIACQNVFAIHRAATLHDFQENEAWPYFDTFNLHHYEPFENYPKLYADFRAVSAGRPLWVTECSRPVKWSGDEKAKEPTEADLRVQAERVAKTYALAVHEGAQAVFYFLLPHYVEGQTQFGIVRPDLTPRPAFLALAAAGRLLADAKPLGQWQPTGAEVQGYLFEAKPDGHRRKVLVLWSTGTGATVELPAKPESAFDLLGRDLKLAGATVLATSAPVFVVLPRSAKLPLTSPPKAPPFLKGKASPVVFQVLAPRSQTDLEKSAYRTETGKPVTLPVFAYNFSARKVRGSVRLEKPAGCEAVFPTALELAPGERRELALEVHLASPSDPDRDRLRLVGDFGSAGRAVLSLRLGPVAGVKSLPR
jgi:hypothetical protein